MSDNGIKNGDIMNCEFLTDELFLCSFERNGEKIKFGQDSYRIDGNVQNTVSVAFLVAGLFDKDYELIKHGERYVSFLFTEKGAKK